MSQLVNNSDVTQDVENAMSFESERKTGPFAFEQLSATRFVQGDNQISINNIEPVETTSSNENKLTLLVYGNDLRNKNPTKIGGVYSFIFINGNPLIILGPQFYMSLILFFVINVINYLLIKFVYDDLNFFFKYCGVIVYILQVISQTHCTLSNPGIPHRNNYVSDSVMHMIYQGVKSNHVRFDKYRVCKRCNILVTLDQHVTHCEECNICVEGIINLFRNRSSLCMDRKMHCKKKFMVV